MKIISLGMGVQSTALYLMSCNGDLPRADYAIFADPGAEHKDTYKMLEWLLDWAEKNDGIPIVVNKESSILKDLMNKQGEFWSTTSDQAAMWPMAEMAGPEHFRALKNVLYVYNRLNPLSDSIRETGTLRERYNFLWK